MADNIYALLQQAWSVAKTSDANLYGVEVAIVTNVKDPEKAGRVKICFPRLPGKPESDWARVVQPSAGSGRGFYWLPEVNDEVLVAFERGQANLPYVLGALWNGKDKPMKDAYTDDNTKRMIQTKSGHQILFEDKAGDEKMSIADKSGKRTLTFDVKNKKFLIEAKEGDVEIHAKKKIVLMCEDLEIKTTKTGKITIGTKFDLKVSDKAGFKAGPKMEIKASIVNLNPPSLDLGTLAAAALAAAARAAAAAAGANAAQQQQAAQAGAALGAALASGGPGGGLVPTTDVVAAAAGGAAQAVADAAQKVGAKAPDGSDWTKAKEAAKGAATDAAKSALGGGKDAAGKDAAGKDAAGKDKDAAASDAPPGPNDITVDVTDVSGKPASGMDWKITLADGTVKTGTTGDDGKISVRGLKAIVDYTLVFPSIDGGGGAAPGGGGTTSGGGGDAGADGAAKADDAPKPADPDGPILTRDDPRLSNARKKLLGEVDKRMGSVQNQAPASGKTNLFENSYWAPGSTSCGLLPSVVLARIGVKGPITAGGLAGVRSEAQKAGAWVDSDGQTLPKPGDIYLLRYAGKDGEDGVSHIGVICDINKQDPTLGELWVTGDAGQGSMEVQEAHYVNRQMKKVDGAHFYLSGPKNTPGDSPFMRRIDGWVDLDKLVPA